MLLTVSWTFWTLLLLLLLLSRFSRETPVRPLRRQPTRHRHPWDSPGKNTGVGCHFLLQRISVHHFSFSSCYGKRPQGGSKGKEYGGGAHCLPSSAGSLSFTTVEPWDPSPLSLHKCDPSLGHQGMKGIESAFAFPLFEGGFASVIFAGVYRGISILWVGFIFPFLTGSNKIRLDRDLYVFFFCFFPRGYVLSSDPCVSQWVLGAYFIDNRVPLSVWISSFLTTPLFNFLGT